MAKIKVCVVVASRANYGRVKSLMSALNADSRYELQIIAGASLLIERYGNAVEQLKNDGFEPDKCIYYAVDGETLVTQAKSTGLGIIELSTAFQELQPDFVVTVADRFETIATAISATYLNIPLIHIQGGEVSGNIDDRVRHAISKMADFHFVATEESRQRLIKMGEHETSVFNYGCPAMDIVASADKLINNEIMSKYGGVGDYLDWTKPYILMIQHPVTTSYGDGLAQVSATLEALCACQEYQKVVLWPNADAGGDDVAKGIRLFRESGKGKGFHFFKNFSPEDFIRVLANAKCAVGNSSSFLREGHFIGVPAVLVGDRQHHREHGENVTFAGYESNEIYEAVTAQLNVGHYDKGVIFGRGDAGQRIADEIATLKPQLIKPMAY